MLTLRKIKMTCNQFTPKPVLEKDIETAATEYAERRGWWCCKFTSPGLVGVPDRIYIRRGRHIFVEWKKPKKDATLQQAKRHRDMRAHGAEVYVFDNLEDFKEMMK